MKRRLRLLGIGSVLLAGLIMVAMLGLADQTQAALLGPLNNAWQQVNPDGFGDSQSGQIPSMAMFGDHLYAGVWHSTGLTTTAQIWRSSDGTEWQQVDNHQANGAAHLVVFDGYLYSGSWDGQIWRSADGLIWTDVITDAFGDINNGIARFAVFSNTLYASTWNGTTGTEIWRSSNGTSWAQFGSDGLQDNANNGSAIASEVFNGYLYWGIGNWATGAQLWRTDGLTLTAVITDGFGSVDNAAISSLAAFGGYLYAGLYNEQGVEVWRSPDGTTWTSVASGGFGNPETKSENSLEVFDGQLYLVARNDSTGLEVWRSADGLQWEQVGVAGFGDVNNQWSYWDNAVTVFQSKLYVGTNNFITGGEIWRTPDYRAYLAAVLK
jgi:hypothetical protein